MKQLGVSVFYTVVHWHKLGEVNNECTLHNSIVFTICVPNISKFGADFMQIWQKQVESFFVGHDSWNNYSNNLVITVREDVTNRQTKLLEGGFDIGDVLVENLLQLTSSLL